MTKPKFPLEKRHLVPPETDRVYKELFTEGPAPVQPGQPEPPPVEVFAEWLENTEINKLDTFSGTWVGGPCLITFSRRPPIMPADSSQHVQYVTEQKDATLPIFHSLKLRKINAHGNVVTFVIEELR